MQGRPPQNPTILPRDNSKAPSLVLFDIDDQQQPNTTTNNADIEDPLGRAQTTSMNLLAQGGGSQ